jgi:hypothetical protein
VRCAHVVISFNAAGAFLYSRNSDREMPCRLLFDPEVVEGMWERGYPGRMVGYTSCLTAGIAKEVMLAPEEPNVRQGIHAGLSALRSLHREGYGQRGASAAEVNLESQSAPSSTHWRRATTRSRKRPCRWAQAISIGRSSWTAIRANLAHPIGKAIFVFAGGTSETLAKYESWLSLKGETERATALRRELRVWKDARDEKSLSSTVFEPVQPAVSNSTVSAAS